MWRRIVVSTRATQPTIALVLLANNCGGLVSEDPSSRSGDGGAAAEAETARDIDATGGGPGAGELPATCGAYLQAVADEASARCGWYFYHDGYDKERPMNPQLAANVCVPALREADCADTRAFVPDDCKQACALAHGL